MHVHCWFILTKSWMKETWAEMFNRDLQWQAYFEQKNQLICIHFLLPTLFLASYQFFLVSLGINNESVIKILLFLWYLFWWKPYPSAEERHGCNSKKKILGVLKYWNKRIKILNKITFSIWKLSHKTLVLLRRANNVKLKKCIIRF